uniref:RNase III domain-containing protein n=1 Tax=Amblyomma maculatum TaxID=34609 RepID=G3MMG9_AMBMU
MENADDFVDIADILDELEGVKGVPKKAETKPLKEAPKTPPTTSQPNGAAGNSHPHFQLKPELVVKLQMEYPRKFVQERLGGYEFKSKSTLLRALLHRTYKQSKRPNNKTFCDPLDYVGDYVLKFIISQYLLEHCAVKTKEQLAQRRALIECQEVYALLAVRNGFHEVVFIDDRRDWEHLNEYLRNVKDVKTLKELGDVEKRRCFIQNFFQSVAGAVYVDSGYDLRTVQRVYLPMLKPFLDEVVDMNLRD